MRSLILALILILGVTSPAAAQSPSAPQQQEAQAVAAPEREQPKAEAAAPPVPAFAVNNDGAKKNAPQPPKLGNIAWSWLYAVLFVGLVLWLFPWPPTGRSYSTKRQPPPPFSGPGCAEALDRMQLADGLLDGRDVPDKIRSFRDDADEAFMKGEFGECLWNLDRVIGYCITHPQ